VLHISCGGARSETRSLQTPTQRLQAFRGGKWEMSGGTAAWCYINTALSIYVQLIQHNRHVHWLHMCHLREVLGEALLPDVCHALVKLTYHVS
jgi:hypothetical protein